MTTPIRQSPATTAKSKKTSTARRTAVVAASKGRGISAAARTAPGRSVAQERVAELIALFGNNRVARLLGVAQSQPGRWKSRREAPSAENAKRIVDLEYVTARFLQAWPVDLLGDWLEGPNPYLNDARPVDVLALEGPLPLIEAIDAGEQGAFA
jgi:uncharacterized protein (DUF2384 family)